MFHCALCHITKMGTLAHIAHKMKKKNFMETETLRSVSISHFLRPDQEQYEQTHKTRYKNSHFQNRYPSFHHVPKTRQLKDKALHLLYSEEVTLLSRAPLYLSLPPSLSLSLSLSLSQSLFSSPLSPSLFILLFLGKNFTMIFRKSL